MSIDHSQPRRDFQIADAAVWKWDRVKKRFPGLVERGAEFSYVPVVVTFGD